MFDISGRQSQSTASVVPLHQRAHQQHQHDRRGQQEVRGGRVQRA